MKKNGFTLIELLAVILILAIIALIAIPIVTNVIEGAKKDAAKVSAKNYINTIYTYLAAQELEASTVKLKNNTTYMVSDQTTMDASVISNIISKSNITNISSTIYLNNIIDIKGEYPIDGYVTIGENKVKCYLLEINGYIVEENNGVQKITKVSEIAETETAQVELISDTDGEINFGDITRIGGELFYVIDNDGENVTLLSKLLIDPTTNLQSREASTNVKYSNISTDYDTSLVKKYIDSYANRLNNLYSVGITSSRLLTKDELISIQQNDSSILEEQYSYWIDASDSTETYKYTYDYIYFAVGRKYNIGDEYELSMGNISDKALFMPSPDNYDACSDFGTYSCYQDTIDSGGSGIRPVIVVSIDKITTEISDDKKNVELISDTDGEVNFGDIASIGGELFYVIDNDGESVTMLTKKLIDPDDHVQRNNSYAVKYSNTSVDYSTSLIKEHVDTYVNRLNNLYSAGITLSRLLTKEEVLEIEEKDSTILENDYNYWIDETSGTNVFTINKTYFAVAIPYSTGEEYELSMGNISDKILFAPEPAVSVDTTPTTCTTFDSYGCYIDNYTKYVSKAGIRPVIVVPLSKIKK